MACRSLDRAADDMRLRTAIYAIANTITRAFRNGGKLMLAGNGGSAADAPWLTPAVAAFVAAIDGA
jgi:phosphoheptose isomerase